MSQHPPLPHLPCDSEGPVFAEPWQAHAFALVLALHEHGVFTWPEWAERLSAEISRAQAEGDPDLGDTYYLHWLSALERLLLEKGIAQPLALTALRQAWRVAAERTPHGQPIVLGPATRARAAPGVLSASSSAPRRSKT
jgi:nitrile hydratase accessory protein